MTGLELNEGMLVKAREKTAHLKNIDVMQGNITDMPFPDGRFDAICCNMVSMSVIQLCVYRLSRYHITITVCQIGNSL